jgi:hypothetical protein
VRYARWTGLCWNLHKVQDKTPRETGESKAGGGAPQLKALCGQCSATRVPKVQYIAVPWEPATPPGRLPNSYHREPGTKPQRGTGHRSNLQHVLAPPLSTTTTFESRRLFTVVDTDAFLNPFLHDGRRKGHGQRGAQSSASIWRLRSGSHSLEAGSARLGDTTSSFTVFACHPPHAGI